MRKLAKKLVGGSSKPLKKAKFGDTMSPPMSPMMNKAVSDSIAGSQKIAQLKSNYDQYELKNSNLKNQMIAATNATKRPGNIRRYEKDRAVQAARSAANEAAIKADYQKNWAGRYPSSSKSPAIAVKKSGGATSAFKKLAPPYNKATFADKIAGAKKKK
jgi:hypothetical protein